MAKKKGMDRTAGTARRKMSESERIRYGIKTNQPLTGSASGVKSINLRQAGEALTQGIVTSRGGKLQFAPEGLAMALPVGKVLKAAGALRAAGKVSKAAALEARVGAKQAGKFFGGTGKKSQGLGLPMDRAVDVGGRARAASEGVFPRLPEVSIPGATRTFDAYVDPLLEGAERFKGKDDLSAFVSDAAILGGMRKVSKAAAKAASSLPKRVVEKFPEAGSVEMVKKTAKQFGQKVSGKEARLISRLLRGRDR